MKEHKIVTSFKSTGFECITNANGTSIFQDRNCGSWIQHWKDYGGNTDTPLCCVSSCNEEGTEGAHVTIDSQEKYIVPMCKSHNGKHGSLLFAKPGTIFVRANQSETCGK